MARMKKEHHEKHEMKHSSHVKKAAKEANAHSKAVGKVNAKSDEDYGVPHHKKMHDMHLKAAKAHASVMHHMAKVGSKVKGKAY